MPAAKVAPDEECRCGFIALVGRPNVGKSTLFNRLVAAHLSPVTHKPQTTRYNIRGVLTRGSRQLVFVDTPGLHRRARYALNRVLNRNVLQALKNLDAVVMMAVYDRWLPADEAVLKIAAACGKPVFLVLNKVDHARDKSDLLECIAAASKRHDFKEIFPLSALRDDSFDKLIEALSQCLPHADFLFDEDQLSDRSERFIVAELVREQLMMELHQELPYTMHVEIESFEERGAVAHISAVVFVEKENQRAIAVGRGGARLKRVGMRARREVEKILGRRVFLRLWVKTKRDWQQDPAILNAYSSSGKLL